MKAELIKDQFEIEWFDKLKSFIETNEFDNIIRVLKRDKEAGHNIFPAHSNLFRAFRETPYRDLRVVIIGQDPYPQAGVADGLAFSCGLTNQCQPSLVEIHREIEKTIYNGMNFTDNVFNPDLTYIAKQGVLLLNSALTVIENKPGSHTSIWQPFIENLINVLNTYDSGLVFILMGSTAKNLYYDKIAPFSHDILTCEHPAACCYRTSPNNRWDSNNVFVETNKILKLRNNIIINW